MAEALGTIAAAVQIADSAVRLRKLWTDIKEMPDALRNSVEDVDLLANTLAQIQNVPLPTTAIQQNSKAFEECLRTLQTVSISFQCFVTDLNNRMTVHKKSGSIRAFLKKDKISECRDRLERLKTTMLLAQQAYTQFLFAQQYTTIIDTLQAIQTRQILSAQTSDPSPNALPTTNAATVSTSDVSVAKTSSHRPTSRNPQQSTQYLDVRLSSWIYQKALKVLINRSHGSWTLNLRVYNRVSSGSDVFVAAKVGDWDKVQRLFDRGTASPFDVDERGNSLLHIAAREINLHGCRFLLAHGLEPNPSQHSLMTPLEYLAVFDFCLRPSSTEAMEIVRLLGSCFEDKVLSGTTWKLTRFYFLSLEVARYLMTNMSFDYQMLELSRRTEILLSSLEFGPEYVILYSGPDLSLSKALSLLRDNASQSENHSESHRTILQQAASFLAFIFNDKDAIQVFTDRWRPAVAEIVACERQNSSSLSFRSHLTHFIRECIWFDQPYLKLNEHGAIWSQNLTSAARVWIKFLLATGVDLENYANAERCNFVATYPACWENSDEEFHIRLSGLSCGPSVDDWALYAVPSGSPADPNIEYEMAGDFWQWTENPELFSIPGAYPHEPEDFYQSTLIEDLQNDWRYLTIGPIY